MPSLDEVNKSEEIRVYKEKHPQKTASEVAAALTKKFGFEFSPALAAAVIKKELRRLDGLKRRGKKA